MCRLMLQREKVSNCENNMFEDVYKYDFPCTALAIERGTNIVGNWFNLTDSKSTKESLNLWLKSLHKLC